jgi:heptosyltransferase-2
MQHDNLLVWLPSPLGDAVLCTPALRAIRAHFESAQITFLGSETVRQLLSPCPFNDRWLVPGNESAFAVAAELKKGKFTAAVLFKNSFASALTVFLAAIPTRTGYSRECRGPLLSEKLYPPKLPNGQYQPLSMLDYYLSMASWLGADTSDRTLQLSVTDADKESLKSKLPEAFADDKAIVVLVPGGAFGLSKCWPADRFAETADRLIENHNATVVISVSPHEAEKKIARQIVSQSRHSLINLADNPLTIGALKALFAGASLVICNDTGPRHIAIALRRKVITLFGPNDPAWTETDHEGEVQIIGRAPCAPCRRPNCTKAEHLCMKSITVERVYTAAGAMLKGQAVQELSDRKQRFIALANSFFVDEDFAEDLCNSGLTSIDAIFSFNRGQNLTKKNLAGYRERIEFQIGTRPKTFFLKRYQNPPLSVQLDKWLCNHGPITCGFFEAKAAEILTAAGIAAAKTIAYGQETGLVFERRSFVLTEQVPNGRSLEKQLPDYFCGPLSVSNLRKRRLFVHKLAQFIKGFHESGLCHRDLYLCHIFCDDRERLTLIDLARTFEPRLLHEKFRVKDIAQLHYSAPAKFFSRTDRLRFYKSYTGINRLTATDKNFIRNVLRKAHLVARHDEKHGRSAPFKDIE